MPNPTTFPGDIIVAGNIRLTGKISPAMAKADILSQAELQPFPIPLTSFRVFDNMAALLPTAGATDDLGIVEGTHGTNTPSLQTEDLKAAGATNNSARVLVQLPWNYVAASSVTLRFMAGYITTAPDTTGTLDCLVFEQEDDPDDAIGSDLYTGAALSIASATFAAKDFALTATNLAAGDILDVKITIATNDGATGTAVIGGISWAHLLCDVL